MTPVVLNKIWSFCLSVVESYRAMWCLVISKMGNVTDAEDTCELSRVFFVFFFLLIFHNSTFLEFVRMVPASPAKK